MLQVREYHLVKTGRNEVTFYYVPVNPGDHVENEVRKVLVTDISNAGLSDRVTVETVGVKAIPRDDRSGKMRQIISQVGVPGDLDTYED